MARPRRMRRSPHRRLIAALSLVSILLILPASVVFLFTPPITGDLTLADRELHLATWLGVSWSMQSSDRALVRQLADELIALRVSDVYVYVSYLKADGRFNQTFEFAPDFLAELKRNAPDLRALAWIGVPVSVEGAEPANRLQSTEVRQKIAEFCRIVVADLGFDGVHLNAELVADGDSSFLETLAAIREALPKGALFSATAHALRPDRPLTVMPYPAVEHHWSAPYLRRAAALVDQIVLMAYDSGLVFPRDYVNWVRYQVSASQAALSDVSAELIVGASVSEEWTISHQTQAESLALFLSGAVKGLADRLDGIALYPYWELDEIEKTLISRALGL